MFETALQREMKGTAEYRLRQGGKESGKYAYFRTYYQSIADYDGKISHIIGRSYDISTERAVREKLLREVQLDPLYAMSQDIPGLVETSSNLASIKQVEGNKIKIVTSQRSSILSSRKDGINNRILNAYFINPSRFK